MSPEVVVQGMEIADAHHPDYCSTYPSFRNNAYRQIAPQLGLDVNMLVMGSTLIDIRGDDVNVFCFEHFFTEFSAEYSISAKHKLGLRMNTEIETPELPDDIREWAEVVRCRVMELDWSEEVGYKNAKNTWLAFRDYVARRVDEDDELKKAIEYADEYEEIIAPQLKIFFETKNHQV